MEPSPLYDFFRRGEVARDVRMLAAQGALAPRASEQLNILVLLLEDPDLEIRKTADDTLKSIPPAALSRFLGGPDGSVNLREFFAGRGILPDEKGGAAVSDLPLIETTQEGDADLLDETLDRDSVTNKLAKMNFTERLKAAMKGTREMRAILVRDTNKTVAAAVMSSPKLTEQEVETFCRMGSVSEDVLRVIARNRHWMKNYKIVLGLAKNPKTPVAISLNLLPRIQQKDLTQMAIDRNIPDPLRIAAKKKVLESRI
jgi:hypothetical protein